MNPAIIVLNYKRYDLAAQTMSANLPIAGVNYGLIVVDQFGLAKALNIGLKKAIDAGYDCFLFMGNDILEPHGFLLRRLLFLQDHPKAGIVSIGFSAEEARQTIVIGNFLITKELVDKIGFFDESYDPYGAIDLDYCNRANKAGFESWYIGGACAKHIDNHGEEDTTNIYGFNKKEMIEKTWHKYVDSTMRPDYTIFQTQFPGE
jgi:GT2 family glycosyltransferase